MLLAFAVGLSVRRSEVRRLGYAREPGHQWVGLGALIGAVLGAKLGMLLFIAPADAGDVFSQVFSLDFTGKTIVGGLIGGYLGVELTKKLVGIRQSTGDGFAVALPLSQAIGRIGCLLNGCCYGAVTDSALGVHMHGFARHPVQIYELVLDLALAGALWATRRSERPRGHLFRMYLIGYAVIRFVTEFFRGDPAVHLGPITLVQLVCLAAAAGFGASLLRRPA